jgi:hypothetical protein
LRKYNKEDRLRLIRACLGKDQFYTFDDKFNIDLIALYTNNVIETLGNYSFANPIRSIDDSLIYFKPMKDHINREGTVYSEIKYATHFITMGKNLRKFDYSKYRELPNLLDSILNAEWKIDIAEDGINKRHIVKPTKINRNMVVVCYANPTAQNYYRVVTILPHRRDNRILK